MIADIKENKEIFDILVHSDNQEVREHIAKVEHLSEESVDILLNDDNINVVDNVLSNINLIQHIKHETLMKIVHSNNIKLLVTIAENIDAYQYFDFDEVTHVLLAHEDIFVRYALVEYVSDICSDIKSLERLEKLEEMCVIKEASKEL